MLAMVGGSIYLAATTQRADKSIVAVASPDGKYKAVRLTVSGDKPVPFCVDTIAIFLSIYPDSFVASEGSYEVYAAPCAAPDKRDVSAEDRMDFGQGGAHHLCGRARLRQTAAPEDRGRVAVCRRDVCEGGVATCVARRCRGPIMRGDGEKAWPVTWTKVLDSVLGI